MFGILLMGISQLFAEVGMSLGKYEVAHKRETLLAMGFLNALWSTAFLILVSALITHDFRFSLESLPTFLTRCVLEVVLIYVSLHALLQADRSTFAFMRTLTIPLLLVADITLGYVLTLQQMLSVALMIAAFLVLTINHGLSRKGKAMSLCSALIPVATITIYKYDITYYNSVEAEQTLTHLFLLGAFIIAALYRRENVFATMLKPKFFTQSMAAGLSTVFLSFAYLYAPASVITSAKRAFEILGAILSGHAVFKEKKLALKLVSFVLIGAGVALMAV